jgi:hypothetical protein
MRNVQGLQEFTFHFLQFYSDKKSIHQLVIY